jgi:hypothetical protein
MKFYKYKQIVKLNFLGTNDLNVANGESYYATTIKGNFHNNEINTKRYKFKFR